MKRNFAFVLAVLCVLLGVVTSAHADTLEQVRSRSDTMFYVMQGNAFTVVEQAVYRNINAFNLEEYFHADIISQKNPDDCIVYLDRTKQQLVVSSAKEVPGVYGFRRIADTMYCYPATWVDHELAEFELKEVFTERKMASVKFIYEMIGSDGLAKTRDMLWTEAVNVLAGTTLDNSGFAVFRYILTSRKEGTVLTLGSYTGTRWYEETVALDALLLQYPENESRVECPVERTRKGYFIIDVSKLQVGQMYEFEGRVIKIVK